MLLQVLDLSGNRLHGPLPEAQPRINPVSGNISAQCLPALREVHLEGNRLNGALPGWLMDHLEAVTESGAPRLTTLDMRLNALDDPLSVEAEEHIDRIVRACSRMGMDCRGLPPRSCSAFGRLYRAKTSGKGCVKCEESMLWPLLLISSGFVLVLAFFGCFAWIVHRYRSSERIKRFLTTMLIIINQLSTLGVIGVRVCTHHHQD